LAFFGLLEAWLLAGLAGLRACAFVTAAFLAAVFLDAVFLDAVFLDAVFLAAAFLAAAFLAFLAVAFLAPDLAVFFDVLALGLEDFFAFTAFFFFAARALDWREDFPDALPAAFLAVFFFVTIVFATTKNNKTLKKRP
jgi:hypothetical protein